MKREPQDRETLARREAGHLLIAAQSTLFAPTRTIWHRLSRYDIVHTDVKSLRDLNWEDTASRNALIANRAALALAGGATDWRRQDLPSRIEDIFTVTGKTDFELAHEWMALQRYDPSQAQIESDIRSIFQKLVQLFARKRAQEKLQSIQKNVLEFLTRADKGSRKSLDIDSDQLLEGTICDLDVSFELHHTLRSNVRGGSIA